MSQGQIYASLAGALLLYSLIYLLLANPTAIRFNPDSIFVHSKPVILMAVGDVNMGRHTGQQLLKGDIGFPFQYISTYLKSADIAFGNLESQLTDLGGETQSPTNDYRFAGPPEGAMALNLGGFDIVSVANNHMWDYGFDSLQETWNNLSQQQILFTGSRNIPKQKYLPAILTSNNQTIAFFAFTDLLNGYEKYASEYVVTGSKADLENMIYTMNQYRTTVDWLIVSMHAGNEYQNKPTARQKELAHLLIDNGANIVIGHHPHVPQGIEKYKNGLIFYSLGNFAFWQPFEFWTQHSFVAEIVLNPDHTFAYNLTPVKAGWQPKLVEDIDIQNSMTDYINNLSEKL